MAYVQHVTTPEQMVQATDKLLLAGSRISSNEIYDMQMDLPMYKGKFFMVKDVANLLTILNGVLTDISEQAYRSHLTLEDARAELNDLKAQGVSSEVNDAYVLLQTQFAQLQHEAQSTVDEMDGEIDVLEKTIMSLNDQLEASRQQVEFFKQQALDAQQKYVEVLQKFAG